MAEEKKITMADQILANAIMAIVLPVVQDDVWGKRRDMWLETVRTYLPQATEEHAFVGPLVNSANALLSAMSLPWPERSSVWARARMDACDALARFSEWRLSLALDHIERQGQT